MDPDRVANFLQENRLEKYIDIFKDEEVEFEDLHKFTPNKAKDLIPKAGPRLRFLEAVGTLKRRLEPPSSVDNGDVPLNQETDEILQIDHNLESEVIQFEADAGIEPKPSSSVNTDAEPDLKKKKPNSPESKSVNLGVNNQIDSNQVPPKPGSSVNSDTEPDPTKNKPNSLESQSELVLTIVPVVLSSLSTGILPECMKKYDLEPATQNEKQELRDFLYNLLISTVEGKYVYNSLQKELGNEKVRDSLCRILISHGLNNSSTAGQISPNKFKYFALSIKALFPNESHFTYYVPQHGSKSPKGKLYWKYNNQRRNFKNTGLIEKRSRSVPENNNLVRTPDWSKDYTPDASILEDLEYVKKNPTTYAVFKPKWVATIFARLQPLHMRSGKLMQIDEYLKLYPALSKNYALDLIKLDFEGLHPGKENLLLHSWPNIEDRIILVTQRKIQTEVHLRVFIEKEIPEFAIHSELAPDDKSLLALRLLATLVSPKSNQVYKKKEKKYSRKDILDDFIIYIPSPNDKSVEINRRIERLKEVNHDAQPVPVVVGTEAENRQYSCEFNSIRFDASSAIEAVDNCFKLIMVLNASYSPFSTAVWLFIQLHIFKIRTDFDTHIPSLESLASDLGLV